MILKQKANRRFSTKGYFSRSFVGGSAQKLPRGISCQKMASADFDICRQVAVPAYQGWMMLNSSEKCVQRCNPLVCIGSSKIRYPSGYSKFQILMRFSKVCFPSECVLAGKGFLLLNMLPHLVDNADWQDNILLSFLCRSFLFYLPSSGWATSPSLPQPWRLRWWRTMKHCILQLLSWESPPLSWPPHSQPAS